jgi:cytochrome c oxidase subunit 2
MTNLFNFAFLDAPTPWQIGFQDPATPIIIGIIHFHNHLIFFLVVIGTFVFWLLYKALVLFKEDQNREASKFSHSTPLEVVWTITPALLLLLIAGPSFALLYSIDEVIAPHMSLKVIGHQWYWSYEYSDYVESTSGESIKFDSYIVSEDDLSLGGLRLLEVDHRVKLPVNVHIRVLVSAADVLHSWAVPSLGIKIDACPGRLNQVSLFLIRKGVFYGQCSEICGVNHAFMPIVVESLSEAQYLDWVNSNLEGLGIPEEEFSINWLKNTLLYARSHKENPDIINQIKEEFNEQCNAQCQGLSEEETYEYKKQLLAGFKKIVILNDARERAQLAKAVFGVEF